MGFLDYVIMVLYMVAMLVIGYIAQGKISTMDDFILGGKRFGLIALSGTIVATMVGSGMVMGAVGNAYSQGAAGTVFWMYAGFSLGLFFFAFIAETIRKTGVRTMAELIGQKFGQTPRLIASVVIILYAVSIVAINIAGLRTILMNILANANISLPVLTAIAAGIAIIYTSMGGFFAVVWTDVVQLGFMLVGIVILGPIIGLNQAGGWGNVVKTFESFGGTITNPLINGISASSVGFFLAYFLTVPGDPTMPQRALAAKDGKSAKSAYLISGVVGVLMGISLLIIGGTTRVIMPELAHPESALLQMILAHYPPLIKGLIVSAVIAAVMSSFDSFLILATTHIVYDVGGSLNKNITEDQLQKMMPWFTIGIGILGLVIALFIQSLFNYLYMVFSVVGSALVPAFIYSLYFAEKSNQTAINASIITGTLVPSVLYLTKGYDVFLGDPVFLGIISSTAVVILLSLVLPKKTKGVS